MHAHSHSFGIIFTLLSLFIPVPFGGTNTFFHEAISVVLASLPDLQSHPPKLLISLFESKSHHSSLPQDCTRTVSVLKVNPPYILCSSPSLAAPIFWTWVYRSHSLIRAKRHSAEEKSSFKTLAQCLHFQYLNAFICSFLSHK